jgi:amino acid adenylation domain-containing protein
MDGHSVSYQELDRRANQWARHLVSLGVGPGSLVGLCLDRSIEMVIGLLAVQKSGAAYVPLDPDYPKERIQYMVSDAEPTVLLTESKQAALFSGMQRKVVLVDKDGPVLAAYPSDSLHVRLDPEALAYVLYTSGSTGKPKGVEIRQRSLVNFLQSMQKRPGCGPDDLLLSVTTLSFDIAGLELYLPLITGACVLLVERTVAADGQKLREKIERSKPTLLQATPATWRMLIDAGWQGDRRMTALCGGEALAPELAAKLVGCVRSLWNMYGPTETTIWSTLDHVEGIDAEITIGRPIANTEIYVLDRHLQMVPIGVPGELYIGGAGLARGYHKRPDLTAERFVPHPFSSEKGTVLYRTGDLARYRSDGKIVHLGRLDHQVKVRGFRIELGEVQTAVASHPGVKQTVVTARDDSSGSKQLVAYIVPNGEALQPQAVRAFVRASLPEYMVPAHVVFVGAFPLTPNGKVDVNALPAPQSLRLESKEERVEPKTPLEIQLAALWQQVLDVSQIGIHDNFFDLGGHSLKAVQLFAHLEQVFSRQLPLATLFQAPTIAQLAEVLAASDWTPPWRSLVAIQPGGSTTPLFAVPGVGGNVLMFAKLAKLLGPDQPFYGLQAIGLDGKSKPLTSVVEIATRYVDEIRTIRPRGPYLIAGTCTGGVIAFEMAQQLMSMGERIELVIMETWHPSSYPAHKKKSYMVLWPVRFVWSRAVSYARALRRMPPREWILFVRAKLSALPALMRGTTGTPLADSSPYHERLVQATLFAVANYQTTAYPGRLLNLVASRRPIAEGVRDTRTEWEALARRGGRTCYIRATDSGRLFVSPHVEELSRHVMQYVSDALQEASSQASAESSLSS